MKRFLVFWSALSLFLGSIWADETVKAVQTTLKWRGFYRGPPNGVYDSETSAAVTRYQIRNGLEISGKLDSATLGALNVSPPSPDQAAPKPSPQAGTWRKLRNGDMQFLEALNAGKIPPPASPPSDESSSPPKTGSKPVQKQALPHVSPPEQSAAGMESRQIIASRERLRDYVGAFVLAGLDPHAGAELEFFADQVNYYEERNMPRENVRRDLIRYAALWPERRFWLAGDLEIDPEVNGTVRITFPLRYDLRNGRKHVTGEVVKTIALQKSGQDDFKVVAVNERKLSEEKTDNRDSRRGE